MRTSKEIASTSAIVTLVCLVSFGSGLLNLWSVVGPGLPERGVELRRLFPLEFTHLSRFAVLLIGFALIISSVNLYRRKKRAFQLVALLSGLSIAFHLTEGLDYEEAVLSGALLFLLLLTRKKFTVESSVPDLRRGVIRLTLALITTLVYGVAGFWVLDRREFGINFTIGDSVRRTLLFLSFCSDRRPVETERRGHRRRRLRSSDTSESTNHSA